MTCSTRDWRQWAPRLATAAVAVGLVIAHGAMLYGLASRAAPAAMLASGIVIFVVLKHLGLFGAAFAVIRRRFF